MIKGRKEEMRKKVVLSTLVLALLSLTVVGIGFNPIVAATPQPTLYIDPPSVSRLVGEDFTVDIRIRDVEEASHLVAWQVRLSYNTTLLDVSATQEGPFLNETAQLQLGSGGTYYISIIEEDIGNITLACMILPNSTGSWNPPWPSGSGLLANVTFHCTGLGRCVLDLEPVFIGEILLDENYNWIPCNLEDGYVIQTIQADVNRDGTVDIFDLRICGRAFGSMAVDDPDTPWDETANWDPRADLKQDGLVDIFDLYKIAKHYLEHV